MQDSRLESIGVLVKNPSGICSQFPPACDCYKVLSGNVRLICPWELLYVGDLVNTDERLVFLGN